MIKLKESDSIGISIRDQIFDQIGNPYKTHIWYIVDITNPETKEKIKVEVMIPNKGNMQLRKLIKIKHNKSGNETKKIYQLFHINKKGELIYKYDVESPWEEEIKDYK